MVYVTVPQSSLINKIFFMDKIFPSFITIGLDILTFLAALESAEITKLQPVENN